MTQEPASSDPGDSSPSWEELLAAAGPARRFEANYGDARESLVSPKFVRQLARAMVARLAEQFERYCDYVPSSQIVRHFLRVDARDASWNDWVSHPDDWYAEVMTQPGWEDFAGHWRSWESLLSGIAGPIMNRFVKCYSPQDAEALLREANCNDVLPEEAEQAVAMRLDSDGFDLAFREKVLLAVFRRTDPKEVWAMIESILMPELEQAGDWLNGIRQSDSHGLDQRFETIPSPAVVISGEDAKSGVLLSGPLCHLLEIRLRWFDLPQRCVVVDVGGGEFHDVLGQFSDLAFERALGRNRQGVEIGLDLIQSVLDSVGPAVGLDRPLVLDRRDDPRRSKVIRLLGIVADGVRSHSPLAATRKSGEKLRGTLQGRMLMASALLRDLKMDLAPASQMMLASSALECLVGHGKDRINETIASHVTFLLEPNPRWRTFASAFVKKLYDHRSAVTHGARDFVPQEAVAQMRTLVSGCMLSLIDRMDYATRMGQPADELVSEDLWDQYRQYALTGSFDASAAGLMAGHDVSIRRVRRLWCADQGIDLRGEADLFDPPERE